MVARDGARRRISRLCLLVSCGSKTHGAETSGRFENHSRGNCLLLRWREGFVSCLSDEAVTIAFANETRTTNGHLRRYSLLNAQTDRDNLLEECPVSCTNLVAVGVNDNRGSTSRFVNDEVNVTYIIRRNRGDLVIARHCPDMRLAMLRAVIKSRKRGASCGGLCDIELREIARALANNRIAIRRVRPCARDSYSASLRIEPLYRGGVSRKLRSIVKIVKDRGYCQVHCQDDRRGCCRRDRN